MSPFCPRPRARRREPCCDRRPCRRLACAPRRRPVRPRRLRLRQLGGPRPRRRRPRRRRRTARSASPCSACPSARWPACSFTGALCARLGAGPVSAVAAVAVCLAAVLPGLVTSVPALCAALLVFGAATGMVNVAANAVGVQVEARVGRPLLSGLHAGFSLGGLGGALLGGLRPRCVGVGAAPGRSSPSPAWSSCAWALPGAGRRRRRRCGAPRGARPPASRRPRPTAVLVVLGAIAGCTAYGEGALTDWGALLLREHLGAPPRAGRRRVRRLLPRRWPRPAGRRPAGARARRAAAARRRRAAGRGGRCSPR